MARFESSIFIAVLKLFFSPCGCQRADSFLQYETSISLFLLLVKMVGLIGLEPMTPALSRRCSNQLSYRPLFPGMRPIEAGGG